MITELRQLWQEAFADTEEFLDSFFETAYSPERCCFLKAEGEVAAALYWLDCGFEGLPVAYIYAVATAQKHRGKGLCHRLMEKAHKKLKEQGYAGAVLVPGSESLFRLYEGMGYERACRIGRLRCPARGETKLRRITAEEYARLRQGMLPEKSILQEGENLRFLERQAELFAGEDFLLAARREKGVLQGLELLGSRDKAPAIAGSLGCAEGVFRFPGNERDFALWLPFRHDLPKPSYFAFAFD